MHKHKNLISFVFQNGELLRRLGSGVLLSKFINKAAPGTIDERVLTMQPRSDAEKNENLQLVLGSSR